MEDVRIGRRARTFQTILAITNANGNANIPANEKRVAISFSSPVSDYYTLSLANVAVIDQGINIFTATPGKDFNIQDHGDLVTKRFTFIHSAGAITIGVFETVLEEE